MALSVAAGLLMTVLGVVTPGDTIRGRVLDDAGKAVARAEVTVSELARRVTADGSGAFAIGGIASGVYTLVAERTGYQSVVRSVNVPPAGSADLTITMRRAPLTLGTVTVTANRATATSADRSPLPVSSLQGESLERETSVSLAHVLDKTAGIHTLSTGLQVGKPVIRGLSGARVLTLDNGLRLEDYSFSDEDGPSIDDRLARRIEVIRGPASVLYGSDAIGGVINVVPRELPDATGGGSILRGSLEAYGASNNAETGGVLGVEGAKGALGWRLLGIGRRAEDYKTPVGELGNTGFTSFNGDAAIGFRGNNSGLTLRYTRYGGDFKLLEAGPPASQGGSRGCLPCAKSVSRSMAEEDGGPLRKLADDRVRLDGGMQFRAVRFEAKGQWQRHDLKELTPAGEGGTPGVRNVAFDLLLDTYTLDLLAHHSLTDMIHGTIGLSGLDQHNRTEGEEALIPGAHMTGGALFGFEQMDMGEWTFIAGGRVDARHSNADLNNELGTGRRTRSYTVPTGDLGAAFHASEELTFSANLGTGFRAPTLFELYAFGPRIGEARFEIGNPDLKAETSVNLDAGARWQSGRVRAELTGFRNAVNHFVYIAPDGAFEEGFRRYFYKQARALLYGAEASLEVQPISPLSLRARYDFVRGNNEETDTPLPLVPPQRIDLEGEWRFTGLSWAEFAYIGGGTETLARQTRLSVEERNTATQEFDPSTPGYTLVNLSAGLQRSIGGRTVRIDLRATNFGDSKYKSFLSRYKEFAFDPGRNITLRLSTLF
ncbi:MAG: TonB-dependent receptor [Gemmatimonadota bacterium]|nr:TonB-dependent receptor [Gemmatimonadota bacterium]